jgi:hypothetical protein
MSEGFTDGPLTMGITTEERGWAMAAHLSALLAVWAGYLGILGTLIIWLIKKDEMRYVDEQGKESLNFQINMFVLGIALVVGSVPVALLTAGLGFLLALPLWLALAVYSVVMPIVAAIKTNAGEAYRYPYIIRVIT